MSSNATASVAASKVYIDFRKLVFNGFADTDTMAVARQRSWRN